MVPVGLKIISCDEYSEILKKGGPAPGGGIGKHKSCPKDAAHAQQLASGKYFSKNYFINYYIKFYICCKLIIHIIYLFFILGEISSNNNEGSGDVIADLSEPHETPGMI